MNCFDVGECVRGVCVCVVSRGRCGLCLWGLVGLSCLGFGLRSVSVWWCLGFVCDAALVCMFQDSRHPTLHFTLAYRAGGWKDLQKILDEIFEEVVPEIWNLETSTTSVMFTLDKEKRAHILVDDFPHAYQTVKTIFDKADEVLDRYGLLELTKTRHSKPMEGIYRVNYRSVMWAIKNQKKEVAEAEEEEHETTGSKPVKKLRLLARSDGQW